MLLLSILIAKTALSQETDCNQVRDFIYGEKCPYPQACSRGYACHVTEDCSKYECLRKEECPVGSKNLPFVPPNPTNDDGDQQGTTSESGYGCFPEDKLPEESFECFFNPQEDNRLEVNIRVPKIMKMEQHADWDKREITLISRERYDSRDQSQKHVDIFGSQNAGENGECVGVEEAGYVVFRNVQNGEKCSFSIDYETDINGALWYAQKFAVGYDDLVSVQPNGLVAISRYLLVKYNPIKL